MKQGEEFARDVLVNVETSLGDLPDALSRIGAYVVAQPEATVRISLTQLAERCECGEASIVRFCRYLGYDGFRDFKIALASDIAYAKGAQVHGSSALADRVVMSLYSTAAGISDEQIRPVAERLLAARHVDIFGSGVSGYVAQIFAYRFSRLGLIARAFQDPVVAGEVSGTIGNESVFITVSETGLTHQIQLLLSGAQARGAFTVAVSGRKLDQLEELCDAVLLTTRLSPLPERGETSPAIAKIFACELLAQQILALRGADVAEDKAVEI